jgi:hypothetical protein
MNPGDLQVEIRSRSVGQTVAMATRLLQERKGRVLFAWALYSLPLGLLSLGLLLGTELSPWWIWLLTLTLASAFSLPMVVTVGHLVFSPTVTSGAVLGTSTRRFVSHLFLLLINRLLTAVGLVGVVVPGFYFWRMGWFIGPIVGLEGSGIGASLRRGRHFAAGFNGLTALHAVNAGALLIYWTGAIAALAHFFIRYAIGTNVAVIGDLTRYDFYPHLLGLGAFCLIVPYVTLYWFFVYLEVRTRKEGWDLEIAFRARAQALQTGANAGYGAGAGKARRGHGA